MAITFYNNWRSLDEEFHFINIEVVGKKEAQQMGFIFCLLGFGIVFIWNV